MQRILLTATVMLLASPCFAQHISTQNTVPVPSNGAAGGANPSVWKAQCKEGMVMTGIEIVVGGSCQNQCDADGRPLAAYRILCSDLQVGKATRMQDSGN
jgi:hypothetical protein